MAIPCDEVQYHCPNCDIDFVVYHSTSARNKHCSYCGEEVELTGRISKIEDGKIVTYYNGKVESTRDLPVGDKST